MEKADKLLQLLAKRDHSVEQIVESSTGVKIKSNPFEPVGPAPKKQVKSPRFQHIQKQQINPKPVSESSYDYEPVRATRPRVSKRVVSTLNPDEADSFEEQVEIVANELSSRVGNYKGISALAFANDWLDCIVNEDDDMYEPVIQQMQNLDKNQLIDFIRVLLCSMK